MQTDLNNVERPTRAAKNSVNRNMLIALAIFVLDLQDANTKLFFSRSFSAYYFLKVHLHNFNNIKSHKKSYNSRSQGFSCHFCLMIEGSGSESQHWVIVTDSDKEDINARAFSLTRGRSHRSKIFLLTRFV